MATRLKLLCHASTAAVRTSAFPGDEPLDDQSMRKLARISHRFGDADRCWTSPMLGASQTADALQLDAIVEPMLRECDYGRWTGRLLSDVQAEAPDAIAQWLCEPGASPHGGETLLSMLARVAAWLDAQRAASGQVVAITHASVIRAAVVHAIDATPRSFWRIDIAPLSVTSLSFSHDRWTLRSITPGNGDMT